MVKTNSDQDQKFRELRERERANIAAGRGIDPETVKELNRLLNIGVNQGKPVTAAQDQGAGLKVGSETGAGGYTLRDIVEVLVINWLCTADLETITKYYYQALEYWD